MNTASLPTAKSVPWNLTSSLGSAQNADVIVLSIAKSGRTWLRVLLNKYLALHYDLTFSLENLALADSSIPSIYYTHELWEFLTKARFREKALGKYLIPDRLMLHKPVVVLYRDPRDVLISMYFHEKKRSGNVGADEAVGDYLRSGRARFDGSIRVMNTWRRRLAGHPNVFWLSYEALQRDTKGRLAALLDFLRIVPVDEAKIDSAIRFAAFGNMQEMERSGAFPVPSRGGGVGSRILTPGDPDDVDSFKVREGKVGAHRQHLTSEELSLLDGKLAELDPFFHYHAGQAGYGFDDETPARNP